ncbi:MAG TPA: choice-of-anchor tandem repeat GloVer-containing protein [Bryobacteraceae bacterium]|nr:choice-of-anchor tandem repeat GloVer-containing protein [Bryobacteraceae bacterium]
MKRQHGGGIAKCGWLAAILCAAAISLKGQTLTTLVSFNGRNGTTPKAGLVQGSDGNFYGTTSGGGLPVGPAAGTVFSITPGGSLTTLYTFTGTAGIVPATGLVQGTDGNFYGGASSEGQYGVGTVFRITPTGTLTTIYNFGGIATDGFGLASAMVQGDDGNFYGTTPGGGLNNIGTVFKITPAGTLTSLYQFGTTLTDGSRPYAGLARGSDGNYYGVTSGGGLYDQGTVFRITPGGALTTLYHFGTASTDGSEPTGGLVQASDGNFYGTTGDGGTACCGTIFRITTGGNLTTIHAFDNTDGNYPTTALIQGADGNLYGTTISGGADSNGTVFRLTLAGVLTTVYNFCSQSSCADGTFPSGLVQGKDGNLYGTTQDDGGNGAGTIFRLQLAGTTSTPYTCTNTTPPVITSIGSASAYGSYNYFASGSWLEIKGTNMADPNDPRLSAATNPGQWTSADFNGSNAPTSLDGISVSVNGKSAYMYYLSPGQLNVQAPEDAATGNVAVTVTNCKASGNPVMFQRRTLAPGLLAPTNYSVNGTQYMVATFQSDGAYVLNTTTGATFGLNSRPAKPGDGVIAYGIGFGDVTPSITPGVIAGQSNTLVNPITISFGSTKAAIAYQGLAGGFVGLYEFYFTVPSNLASGDYQINVMQGGVTLPQTFYLTVQSSGSTGPTTPALQSVTLSSSSVTGGTAVTGTVSLTAAAPVGGAVVTLATSSAAAIVPASVMVLSGATSATFPISTSSASTAQPVTITASYQGHSAQATLIVNPGSSTTLPQYNLIIANVTLSIAGSGNLQGQVQITAAPGGGYNKANFNGQLSQDGSTSFTIIFQSVSENGLTFTLGSPEGQDNSYIIMTNTLFPLSSASATITLTPGSSPASGSTAGTFSMVSAMGTTSGTMSGSYLTSN